MIYCPQCGADTKRIRSAWQPSRLSGTVRHNFCKQCSHEWEGDEPSSPPAVDTPKTSVVESSTIVVSKK